MDAVLVAPLVRVARGEAATARSLGPASVPVGAPLDHGLHERRADVFASLKGRMTKRRMRAWGSVATTRVGVEVE